MHDPQTVAFEIRRPWPSKKDPTYFPTWFTIWHVDPELDGTDDSCDWFHRHLTDEERTESLRLITNDFDNLHIFFGPLAQSSQVAIMTAQWKAARRFYRPRPWYRHPRWHMHHWKIQWQFGQTLARYLFSRCCKCGGRFAWNESIMGPWHGDGPRFFRGERGVYHMRCDNTHVKR